MASSEESSTKERGQKYSDQFAFPFPARPPSYSAASFILGPSNEKAVDTARAWLAADLPVLCISGPSGAGKTHLAAMVKSGDISPPGVDSHSNAIYVIDDAERRKPAALLAEMQDALAAGQRVCLAGLGTPASWAGDLRDLETRLCSAPRANLSEPDETLIRAVIKKLFDQRQLAVSESVIEYAVRRLPRRFVAASAFVAGIEQWTSESGKAVTTTAARDVLLCLSF